VTHFGCLGCGLVLRVFARTPEEYAQLIGPDCDWWPDRYPCPECSSKMRNVDRIQPGLQKNLRIVDATTLEAFAAFSGAGVPTPLSMATETIKDLLLSQRIVRVEGRDIPGTDRSSLDTLELEDGTRLYLGASSHGAVVYRVGGKLNE